MADSSSESQDSLDSQDSQDSQDEGNAYVKVYEAFVNVLVVDELYDFAGSTVNDASSTAMVHSLWSRMPKDLLEIVLLFLPSSSQARFRTVCKRWKKVMTSVSFRERSSSIALSRGYPLCIVGLPGIADLDLVPVEADENWKLKELSALQPKQLVRRVKFPGLMLPKRCACHTRLFVHGGLLALSWRDEDSKVLRCWLLNLMKQTWQELPPLAMCRRSYAWNLWLRAPPEGNFQVFVARQPSSTCDTFYTYFSGDTCWRKVCAPQELQESYLCPGKCSITKGRNLLWEYGPGTRMWRWEGNSIASIPHLPDTIRLDQAAFVSEPDMDVVLGYQQYSNNFTSFFRLYVLEEENTDHERSNPSATKRRKTSDSKVWQWKCVVDSEVLPEWGSHDFLRIKHVKIVGHTALMVVVGYKLIDNKDYIFKDISSFGSHALDYNIHGSLILILSLQDVCSSGSHILVYNIHDNSCKRFLLQTVPLASWSN